jgi:hypothetical protein
MKLETPKAAPSDGCARAAGAPALRAALAALALASALALPRAARAEPESEAAAAARERAVRMQRFIVSATRVDKNPWRYASLEGFEILSRAPDNETSWMLDSLRRGLWLQNDVMPKDWLPEAPVPYTVLIDDTDMSTVQVGQLHSQPIKLETPADAVAWGQWSGGAMVWADRVPAYDGDTLAFNTNVFGVDMRTVTYGSVSLERLGRCAPPLPRWLAAGLVGQGFGIFREGFVPIISRGMFGSGWIHRADGAGTLWVSVDETKRLLLQLRSDSANDKTTPIAMLPLRELFDEAQPAPARLPLWESEAALFVRWGLMGPGSDDPVTARGFRELVRRARLEPVTEKVFTECMGLGFEAMESRLGAFLRAVLAKPTTLDLDIPAGFPRPRLKPATADQIGRILGDWLRMQGDSFRSRDPALSRESFYYAGRMLERAYREDNGMPPDVDPSRASGSPAAVAPNADLGPAVAMKPFIVTAGRIHDSRLLAVYGLYEHDTGDDGKARELLEAAVATGVMRPAAFVVLAKLRFTEASANPAGAGGKLGAGQAASVIEPLRTALRFAPTPDAYSLMIGVWTNCEATPAAADLDEIARGVALYPRNTDLAYNAALLCLQCGLNPQAGALIDKALVFATDPRKRAYLMQLRPIPDEAQAPNPPNAADTHDDENAK